MNLLAALLLVIAPVAAFGAERAGEFAYAVPIEIDGGEALYQLDVPQSAYEGAARGDLGDLRVFNGNGEVVPHAFKPRPAPATVAAQPIELPYFPLQGSRGRLAQALDIRAERNAGGTIVRVISGEGGPKTARVLLGYLVDATGFKAPLKTLELDWRTGEAGFSGVLHVEGSNDLTRWATLAAQAPIVSLQFAGQRLEQKTVDLPSARHKYLRLSWPAAQKPVELIRLYGRPGDVTIEPDRQWKEARGTAGEKPGEYTFDLGGRPPVDRLRFTLPEENTLVSAQVFARNGSDQPWQPAGTAVLYRLRRDGQEVTSPDVRVAGGGRRYWLLRVDQKGGGIGQAAPGLQVGWVPQQLVFVARGRGPFLLAYGNARMGPSAYSIETIVPGWRSDAEIKAAPAKTGPQQVLAGPSALRERPDYRTYALWSSLVLGVLVLGWMAWRLTRDLKAATKESSSERGGDKSG